MEGIKSQKEEGEKPISKGSEKLLHTGETLVDTIGMNITKFGNKKQFMTTGMFLTRNGTDGSNFHIQNLWQSALKCLAMGWLTLLLTARRPNLVLKNLALSSMNSMSYLLH